MKLRFERLLPVPPRAAWPYLTVAEHMNRWSEAVVTPERDGHTEGRPGSRRSVVVHALGLRVRLHEVVVSVEEPHQFCYRVVAGGMLRHHLGTIRLEPCEQGTQLTWEVEFETTVPGASALLARILRPKLERSLAALDAILRGSDATAHASANSGVGSAK